MAVPFDRSTIGHLLAGAGADAWGVAGIDRTPLPFAPALPRAISIVRRLDPAALVGVENGPTTAYLDEYHRANQMLDDAAALLVHALRNRGHLAEAPPATRDDARASDQWFSHKSAATVAGLGWIGKTGLFVSAELGPAVRLVTVFTDLSLRAGSPVTRGACGSCRRCVDACPAGAGRDIEWAPGLARDEVVDAFACERYMESHFSEQSHTCGICVAVCPRRPRHGAVAGK